MSLYYVKYWKLDKHIQVKSIKDARISVKHIFVKIGNVLIYLFCWLWHFIFTKMKFTRILLACYKSFLLAGWQIQISKYKKRQSLISWKLTYYTSWDFFRDYLKLFCDFDQKFGLIWGITVCWIKLLCFFQSNWCCQICTIVTCQMSLFPICTNICTIVTSCICSITMHNNDIC